METAFKRSFARDLRRVPQEIRSKVEVFIFETVPNAQALSDLEQIVHLSGYTGYYRKRFGDYRLGFKCTEGTVVFYRILPRGEIYKRFP